MFKYKKIISIIIMSTIAGLILVISIVCKPKKIKVEKILDQNQEILNIYESELSPFDDSVLQENGRDYVNYWQMASNAIHYANNDELSKADYIADNLMNTYYATQKFPRPEYKEYQEGWTSCMDAPVVAVLMEIMYEKTGDSKYNNYLYDILPMLTKKSKDGGYIIEKDHEKWMLEYCDEQTTEDNAEYVLNGSLVGTLSTYLVGQAIGNEQLINLASSNIDLYKKYKNEYWYNDNTWCYYSMGNGKVVDPVHYIIFEIRLLQDLNKLTSDNFFMDEANRRIELLKSYYPLYIKDNKFLFLRGGAPHYYYTDMFGTKLEFYDSNNRIIKTEFKEGKMYADSVIEGDYPHETDHVDWVIESQIFTLDLGELNVENKNLQKDQTIVINDSIISNDENSEYQIQNISYNVNANVDYKNIFGVEIQSSDSRQIVSVVFTDSENNSISRYLPGIKEGKNLIIAALPGMNENSCSLKNIEKIDIRVYTNKGDSLPSIISENAYRFNDVFALHSYLGESDYVLNFGSE